MLQSIILAWFEIKSIERGTVGEVLSDMIKNIYLYPQFEAIGSKGKGRFMIN